MNFIKKLNTFAIITALLCGTITTVYADNLLFPMAVWDMSEITYSYTGGDPTTYYINDSTGQNRSLQAFYGSTFQNGYTANSSYSEQKYVKMNYGPYFIKRYNEQTLEYDPYDEELLEAMDDKFTFETWVKFPSNVGVGALFMVFDEQDRMWNTALYTGNADKNGEVGLVFRRFLADNTQRYFQVSKRISVDEWTHIILAYDAADNTTVNIYINGEKVSSSDAFNAGPGNLKPHREGKTVIELARYFENIYQPLANTAFGRTAFYRGIVTLEEAAYAYNSQKSAYENGFGIQVANNGMTVEENFEEGSFELTVNCVDVDLSTVTEDSVKIIDEEENERPYTAEKDENNYILRVDFIGQGKFSIVFDETILDKNGQRFRKSPFVASYEVDISNGYRENIKNELNDLFSDESLTDEMLMNKVLDEYNYILKFDISEGSEYSKIINKTEVFHILKQKKYDTFEDIVSAFSNCVREQAEQDILMAIEEFNKASQDKNDTQIAHMLFEKYASVYRIDDSQYQLLKDPTNVLKKMFGSEFTNIDDIVQSFYQAVIQCKDDERRAEFAEKIPFSNIDTIEQLLNEYNDVLDIDLEDENFIAQKNEVLGDIIKAHITDHEKFKSTFYESVLLNSINAVPKGNRAKIGTLLDTYEEYWDQPTNYKNATNTQKEQLYIKLNGMTHSSLNALSRTISDLLANIISESTPVSSGGGASHKSSVKGDNFTVNNYTQAETIPGNNYANYVKPKTPFEDIADVTWACEAIEHLYEKGVINGKSEKLFAPNDSVTRSEIAKMVAVAFDIKSDGNKLTFEDVSEDLWCHEYVCALTNAGLLKGQTAEVFGKDDKLCRADLAVISSRLISYKNITVDHDKKDIIYADDDNIPNYAKEAVYEMCKCGIMVGMDDGTFGPKGYVTRAQAAKVIYLIMNLYK